jgi:predicted DNA-binding transcriptional regulator AlpA
MPTMNTTRAARVAAAKKPTKRGAKRAPLSPVLIAANTKHQHAPPAIRLLNKAEVCAVANATYPTVWKMMRAGKFPRSRVVGGMSKWRSDEIQAWLNGLEVRRLKGDAPVEAVA